MAKNKINGSLDTNILLRLLVGDVPKQAEDIEILIEKSDQLDVSDAVIIETVFVLEKVYGLERSIVRTNINAILSNPKMICNGELFRCALDLYEKESKLSIVDCVVLQHARINKTTPLYSFDKALIKKSGGDCVSP
jgi:predicted nucleic-acid-binding protein